MSERHQENEYFNRQDAEKIAKLREKEAEEARQRALEERRVMHHHRCGKCGAQMSTHPYRGVEIEICDECGAVLLDRGELEKLAGGDGSGIFSGFLSMFGG